MINRQEIFGAGDLKANEELRGTGSGKKNVLTKEWLLEKSEEIVREELTSAALKSWIEGDHAGCMQIGGIEEKAAIFGYCDVARQSAGAFLTVVLSEEGPQQEVPLADITEQHFVILLIEVISEEVEEGSEEMTYKLGDVVYSTVDQIIYV